MGTYQKGVMGAFSGTIGTVIGGSWRDIDYMRSLPTKRKRTPTDKQLDQQARFAAVVKFLSGMATLLETGFKQYAVRMSGYNSALSYNIQNAVTGRYPDYSIDYSNALVSRGKLLNAADPKATATGDTVFFTWTDNSDGENTKPDDAAILVVYCEALENTIYTLNGGTRSAGAGNIKVAVFKGNRVQTWLAFISADGLLTSNSVYTGELSVG
ncbi:MAG: hypothetical protein JO072_09500 [Parafilimonas sp.]|nr:hypothetical protein [Parafilimonas sp.]